MSAGQVLNGPMKAFDIEITRSKIDDAVAQIVALTHPLRVVAFGSWARGENGPDSDLDLAVILDAASDHEDARYLRGRLENITMALDVLCVSVERYELFRHSVNSVYYDIDHEGVVLYGREQHGSTSRAVAA